MTISFISDDQTPTEFRARFSRRARTVAAHHRAKHRGARLAALAVAVAVPAFAAPAEWVPGGTETAAAAAPMAFETPGESFPGSAFFYLAEDPDAPLPQLRASLAPDAHWDNEPADVRPKAAIAGPAANPLMARGTTTDQSRALNCLTEAVYYEAASESDAGQRAVAQVVLNRVTHPAYPATVCGVVYQGASRRTGCQFTFTCDGSLARRPSRFSWDRARAVAQGALSGHVYAPIGLATHYHTIAVHPYWASSLTQVGIIGAHIFYRFGGAAGKPAAFRNAYLGAEPAATAIIRQDSDNPQPTDIAALASITAPDPRPAQVKPAQTKAPDYSDAVRARGGDSLYNGANLPSAGSVRAEYAHSGEWITKP